MMKPHRAVLLLVLATLSALLYAVGRTRPRMCRVCGGIVADDLEEYCPLHTWMYRAAAHEPRSA